MPNRVKVIGICGKARSGKDTFARFLATALESRGNGVVIMHLADPIRAMLKTVLAGLCPPNEPVSSFVESCYHGERKELPLTTHNSRTAPRYLMQTLGTDWGREMIDESLWLWILDRRIDRVMDEATFNDDDVTVYVIVPDVRYDNEADYIGGGIIKVVRPNSAEINQHASEAGIDEDYIAITVWNDEGLDELNRQAQLIAEDYDRGTH